MNTVILIILVIIGLVVLAILGGRQFRDFKQSLSSTNISETPDDITSLMTTVNNFYQAFQSGQNPNPYASKNLTTNSTSLTCSQSQPLSFQTYHVAKTGDNQATATVSEYFSTGSIIQPKLSLNKTATSGWLIKLLVNSNICK